MVETSADPATLWEHVSVTIKRRFLSQARTFVQIHVACVNGECSVQTAVFIPEDHYRDSGAEWTDDTVDRFHARHNRLHPSLQLKGWAPASPVPSCMKFDIRLRC